MKLATFIEHDIDRILEEWDAFAATLLPAAESMDAVELRDLAAEILRTLCDDVRRSQSEQERHDKSIGGLRGRTTGIGRLALGHAEERLAAGFSLDQLLAEYRALRASVIRLWCDHVGFDAGPAALEELVRFNEAVDESLAEAVGWYNRKALATS